jgi:PPK2 family polyphosphate:nucleotide phosphotransferase
MKIEKYLTFNPDWNKDKIKGRTKSMLKEIGALQYKMYAEQKHSLLIVFQGLDASGKDGLTRGLLRYCNPIGVKIKGFKKPTPDEFAHDFLWRVHQAAPAKGDIQIFIRSHYEDILVPSVEGYYTQDMIDQRYGLINEFEKLLEHNNTHILKFYLNVSLEAQKERLMERIELNEKHWKHKDGDWETRKKFDRYQEVYERIFRECNDIPWHMVPADKNWQKLYYVAKEVLKTLKSLNSQWPDLESTLFEVK